MQLREMKLYDDDYFPQLNPENEVYAITVLCQSHDGSIQTSNFSLLLRIFFIADYCIDDGFSLENRLFLYLFKCRSCSSFKRC